MELIVKVSDVDGDSSYKDGDVVQAFSNEKILLANARVICSPENSPLDSTTGLRENDGLLEKFMENISLYRFIRQNSTDVKRINLSTAAESIVGKDPNEDGEFIDVHAYLTNKLRNPKHLVFGSAGSEVWYGSQKSPDLDVLWNEIESHTDFLKQDYYSWPFSETEKRHFLPLNCRGFAGSEFTELSNATVSDKNLCVYSSDRETIIAKRRWQVPYWDLSSELSININDIRDASKLVDGRKPFEERSKVDDINVDKVVAGIVIIS
jgi:hypothetical protein